MTAGGICFWALACSSEEVPSQGAGGASSSGGLPAAGGAGAGGLVGAGGSATGGLTSSGGEAGTGGDDGVMDPGTEGDGNHVIGPDYVTDPALTNQGNPQGKEFTFTMSSEDSEYYNGNDATLNDPQAFSRQITVYIPAAYQDGDPAPFLVHHDGTWHFDLVKNALDNLTISEDSSARLPAFIAIAVNNGGGDSKGSQRGLEYDTVSDRFGKFIQNEVLPAVLNNAEIKAQYPNIAFTDNPQGRATIGCSSGGAAAFTMGWFHPEWFGRIITYSGTFVDQQDDDAAEEAMYPLGAWEYHSSLELIQNAEKKNLRVFLHVSENDLGWDETHDWEVANDRMAEDLEAKGYHYRFLFSQNAGHCDDKVFNETLAETLLWTWRGYPTD